MGPRPAAARRGGRSGLVRRAHRSSASRSIRSSANSPSSWRSSPGSVELIPIIGPIISAVPAVLLGLTAGPVPALAALLLYLGIQLVENNFLVPKIQSDAIDLHPSAIIAALVIGGAIFGLLGAVLALPVTAAFRDVFKYVFRRAGEIGGAEQVAAPRPRRRSPRWRRPAAGSPWRPGRSPSDDRSARPGLRPVQGPPDRPGGRSRDRSSSSTGDSPGNITRTSRRDPTRRLGCSS